MQLNSIIVSRVSHEYQERRLNGFFLKLDVLPLRLGKRYTKRSIPLDKVETYLSVKPETFFYEYWYVCILKFRNPDERG